MATTRHASIVGVLALAGLAGVVSGETTGPDDRVAIAPVPWSDGLGATIDPGRFFEALVGRYRCLSFYTDRVHVVRVVERYGEAPRRVETDLNCEIREGELHVQTPERQVLESLGIDLPVRTGEAVKAARQRQDLQLAPHMALKFTEAPLDELREPGRESFTPTEAEPVTIGDRPMVHLQLRTGDGLSEDCEAKFELYVDPDSMLIERITGEERLPDGATQQTTMEITPVHADCEAEAPEPVVPAVPESAEPPVEAEPETDLPPARPAGAGSLGQVG